MCVMAAIYPTRHRLRYRLIRRGLFSFVTAGLIIGSISSPALAASTTTTFNVSANVLATCVVSATNLDFGTYTPSSGSPNDATSTVNVTCVNNQGYSIALDAGAGAGATVANRLMTAGGATLSYALYTSSALSTVWGDGSASTGTVAGAGSGVQQSYTVYGRVAAGQFVPAGAYSDTITVTVAY